MANIRKVPEVVLSSGWKMPLIGMGTGATEKPTPPIFNSLICHAIETGYKHFDTAALYNTEKPLGQSINEALHLGLIQTRDELFITSKLWCTDNHPDLVLPALHKTLQNLQLDYIDLYLIHWPVRLKGEPTLFFSKSDLLPIDMKPIWEAMEECQKLGLTKSIGVSNFSCKKLSQLLEFAKIPPAVNQVEMNPAWQQKKLREFCAVKGIQLCAYSPLGANGAFWGSLAVMNSPVLKEIADAKGKSVAQISLRWLFEQGVGLIVKSFNRERMKENLDIFDWELSEDELKKIGLIPQQRGCPADIFVSAEGPYNSLEDLWDGEI